MLENFFRLYIQFILFLSQRMNDTIANLCTDSSRFEREAFKGLTALASLGHEKTYPFSEADDLRGMWKAFFDGFDVQLTNAALSVYYPNAYEQGHARDCLGHIDNCLAYAISMALEKFENAKMAMYDSGRLKAFVDTIFDAMESDMKDGFQFTDAWMGAKLIAMDELAFGCLSEEDQVNLLSMLDAAGAVDSYIYDNDELGNYRNFVFFGTIVFRKPNKEICVPDPYDLINNYFSIVKQTPQIILPAPKKSRTK